MHSIRKIAQKILPPTTEKKLNQYSSDVEDYKSLVYQVSHDLHEGRHQKTVISLKDGIWNHPSFEEYKYIEEEQNDYIKHPFEVEEGVITCKCGSSRVVSFSKQSRSSDEPMTTYATCFSCGNRWTYSG